MAEKLLKKKKEVSDIPSATVYNLLRVLKIPATYSYVEKTLNEHPDYPSILSMAETLPEWGVKTEGVKGGIKDLTEIDYPSIVHLSNDKKEQNFAVLENIQDENITLTYSDKGREIIKLSEFAEIWSGVLLRAFPQENASEKNYEQNKKEEQKSILHSILIKYCLPLLFIILYSFGLTHVEQRSILIPLSIGKIIGFILCTVMVTAALGKGSMFKSLCPMGRVVNCARVMRSPAGKLFGVSMAEWGLIYFGSGLLTLLLSFFFGHFDNDLLLLGIIGLFLLPYTLFSIIYQAFWIRSWCWMCVVIMGIFWFEFYLLYDKIISFFKSFSPIPGFLLTVLLGFGSVLLIWIALKKLINEAKQVNSLKFEAMRIKRQPEFIQFKLNTAETVDMGNFPVEVEIGPEDAKLTITIIVNPLCGHCWRAVNSLNQLIDIGQGKIKGAIRFLVTPDKEEETPTETEVFIDREVSIKILSLAQNSNRDLVYKCLLDWFKPNEAYSKGKFNRWYNSLPKEEKNDKQKATDILNLHLEWAKNNKIFSTPAVFFNNRLLPRELQLNDLKIFFIRQINN